MSKKDLEIGTTQNLEGIVQISDEKYRPPKAVIENGKQARVIYNKLQRSHVQFLNQMNVLEGQLFGNAPIDEKYLIDNGLEYKANYDWGHHRTIVNHYYKQMYLLVNSVKSPVNIKLNLPSLQANTRQLGSGLSVSWGKAFPQWRGFYNNLNSMIKFMIVHGFSFLFFPDSEGIRFTALDPKDVLLPKFILTDLSNLTYFVVKHKYTPQQLWEYYQDEGNDFWNKKGLGKLLFESSNRTARSLFQGVNNWEDSIVTLQRRIRNQESCIDELYDTEIEVASVYTQEYKSMKWTHTMIPVINLMQPNSQETNSEAIFYHKEQYDDLSNIIHAFPFEGNEPFLKSNKGLSYKIYNVCDALNLTYNNLLDQGLLNSIMWVRTRGGGRGRDPKLPKIVPGVINDIGEAEIQQARIGSDLNATIALTQTLQANLDYNKQMESVDFDVAGKSLGELGMIAQKESTLTRPQADLLYNCLDRFYVEHLRRCLTLSKSHPDYKYVKEWKEVAIGEFGVPEETFKYSSKDVGLNGLPRIFNITATRSLSTGSKIQELMLVKNMFPLSQRMSSEKQHNFLQFATETYGDYNLAQEFFPDNEKPNTITDEKQEALQENNEARFNHEKYLQFQQQIPTSETDAHLEHFPVHLQMLQEVIGNWINQLENTGTLPDDTLTTDSLLQVMMGHIAQHEAYLGRFDAGIQLLDGYRGIMGEIKNRFRQINAEASNLRHKQANEQQKLANQQALEAQGIPATKEQVEVQKIHSKERMKEADLQLAQRQQQIEIAKMQQDDKHKLIDSNLKNKEITLKDYRENKNISYRSLQNDANSYIQNRQNNKN